MVDYERRIRIAIWPMLVCCSLTIAALGFPFTGWWKPSTEPFGSWFARAGAPVTIFALIAQTRVARLSAVLTPGHFGHMGFNSLRDKYRWCETVGNAVALVMTIVGTVIWAYGDLVWKAL
jgi:hypothetical protein